MAMLGRYVHLFRALDRIGRSGRKHLVFLEVGTYDGVRASQLLSTWLKDSAGRTAHYIGFDLFELCTPEIARAELSKERLPPRESEVKLRLLATGAQVTLFKGFTRDRLVPWSKHTDIRPDLIFLDGGHSLDTVASDWGAVARVMGPHTLVLLDDYYEGRDDFGCRPLVNGLDRERYQVVLLDPVDHFTHTGLDIRMVEVTLRP